MMWPYTQSDHDLATEQGGIGMVMVVTVALIVAILVLAVVA